MTEDDIYRHTLANGAALEDFVESETPCFVRKIVTDEPFTLQWQTGDAFQSLRDDSDITIYRAQPGQPVFCFNVTDRFQTCAVFAAGAVRIDGDRVTAGPGEGVHLYGRGSTPARSLDSL